VEDIMAGPYGRLGPKLTPQQQQFFQREYSKQSRNPSKAFILALLLGGFGAHRFYLGQRSWGITYLLFCWTLIPLVASWVECFSIRERIENRNKEIEQQIIQTMNIISVQEASYAVAA
jgi:TM2 domain-containing membrane protein YozV